MPQITRLMQLIEENGRKKGFSENNNIGVEVSIGEKITLEQFQQTK